MATADWPQFHGPVRDSICRERGLLQTWPEGGPKQLWTLEGLGRGYSTISIAGGKLFTMGDRVDASGEDLGAHQAFWFAWSQFHPGSALWPDADAS